MTKNPRSSNPAPRRLAAMIACTLAAAILTTIAACSSTEQPAQSPSPPAAAATTATTPAATATAATATTPTRTELARSQPTEATQPPQAAVTTAPATRPATTPAAALPGEDWTQASIISRTGSISFTVTLPPRWTVSTFRGPQSLFGEISGPDMKLQYDYRPRATKPRAAPGQTTSHIKVNGREAELTTAPEQDGSPGHGITTIFLADPDGDPDTDEALLIGAMYSTPLQMETAVTIFRSVQIPAVPGNPGTPVLEKHTPAANEPHPGALDAARTLAPAHLKLNDGDEPQLEAWRAQTWPDGSLGCQQEGISYISAEVEGYRMTFRANEQTVNVHTDETGRAAKVPEDCAAPPQSTQEDNRATAVPPTRVPEPTMPSTGDPRQDALRAMYELPWMKDGATPQERETADRIEALSRYNGPLSLRVVSMPFLQTHQITDTGAVSALAHISLRDRPAADQIVNHPTLSGGIEDEDTVAVTLTYGEWLLGNHHHHRLLEASSINWQTHQASLPLSGTAAITIVTAGENNRATETARKIAQDLAWLETYLDQPLSTHNVLLHYGSGLRPPVKGANVQASIMQPASHDNDSSYHWAQHELVHYWFNSNEGWLDEGMAQVLTSLLNSEGEPSSLPATSPSCPESTRIRDIETTNPETAVGSRCLYAVGERFIRTLYQEAGYQGFRTGAANLAARANRPPFRGMGIEEIRAAFAATPHAVQTAEDRWK